jgi:hypothetical protein
MYIVEAKNRANLYVQTLFVAARYQTVPLVLCGMRLGSLHSPAGLKDSSNLIGNRPITPYKYLRHTYWPWFILCSKA